MPCPQAPEVLNGARGRRRAPNCFQFLARCWHGSARLRVAAEVSSSSRTSAGYILEVERCGRAMFEEQTCSGVERHAALAVRLK
jgi:hypothetical protein